MQINRIVVGQLDVNCYVISDEYTSEALIIDPGDEAEKIAEFVELHSLKPVYIVLTHAHYDHVCAAADLKERFGCRIMMHGDDMDTYLSTKERCITWGYGEEDFPPPDVIVREGDRITLGGITLDIVHTPGHTPGCICISADGILFTGDTLFKGSAGRTDLPGGSSRLLMSSLKRLSQLPPETRVLCGHGDETTIGIELRTNPFFRDDNLLRFMN